MGERQGGGATTDDPTAGGIRLVVPARQECLPVVRDTIRAVARLAGFREEGADYPATVASHLTAVLLSPQMGTGGDGEITVHARTVGSAPPAVLVTVHEDGPPFDPRLGGRAEQFAHALLGSGSPDWLAFTNQGRGGREISALLHPPGTRAGEADAMEPPAPEDDGYSLVLRATEPSGAWAGRVPAAYAALVGPGTPAGETGEITDDGGDGTLPDDAAGAIDPASTPPEGDEPVIGLLRPEQAAAVGRCFFDAYRLTYTDESMYRPARLIEANASGEIVSVVAVAPDGTVAGHGALLQPRSPGHRRRRLGRHRAPLARTSHRRGDHGVHGGGSRATWSRRRLV